MKKFFYLFALIMSMILNSCVSEAQVAYGEYYDNMNHITVVYMDNMPYYRIWESNRWVYRIVPIERRGYIRYSPKPIPPHQHRPTPLPPPNRGHVITPQRHGNDRPRPNVQPNSPTNNRGMGQPNRGGGMPNRGRR